MSISETNETVNETEDHECGTAVNKFIKWCVIKTFQFHSNGI